MELLVNGTAGIYWLSWSIYKENSRVSDVWISNCSKFSFLKQNIPVAANCVVANKENNNNFMVMTKTCENRKLKKYNINSDCFEGFIFLHIIGNEYFIHLNLKNLYTTFRYYFYKDTTV